MIYFRGSKKLLIERLRGKRAKELNVITGLEPSKFAFISETGEQLGVMPLKNAIDIGERNCGLI